MPKPLIYLPSYPFQSHGTILGLKPEGEKIQIPGNFPNTFAYKVPRSFACLVEGRGDLTSTLNFDICYN